MILIPSDKRIFECDCHQIANNHQSTAVHKQVHNIQRDRVGSYKKKKESERYHHVNPDVHVASEKMVCEEFILKKMPSSLLSIHEYNKVL
jgi:hypothetical protein